ncbi:MAG: class I SAM-dependent methyltransferase [Planctomycetota bacterium]|nr:class I SAM-dependent methyltransferase [Planctomycetota bacterium]
MSEAKQLDSLAAFYDVWVASAASVMDPHPAFYGGMYVETEGPVVELGVGNGRILIEAARQGKHVIGVDCSTGMLELCRSRAAQAGVADKLTLIQADFRDFELAEPAALISIPFHSIGHLVTLDDKRAALTHIHSQLRPGGRLVFDHFVYDPKLAAQHRSPVFRSEFKAPSGRDALLWALGAPSSEPGQTTGTQNHRAHRAADESPARFSLFAPLRFSRPRSPSRSSSPRRSRRL